MSSLSWRGQIQGRFDYNALEDGIRDLLRRRGLAEDELLKDPTGSAGCKTWVSILAVVSSVVDLFDRFVCATSQQSGGIVVFPAIIRRDGESECLIESASGKPLAQLPQQLLSSNPLQLTAKHFPMERQVRTIPSTSWGFCDLQYRSGVEPGRSFKWLRFDRHWHSLAQSFQW